MLSNYRADDSFQCVRERDGKKERVCVCVSTEGFLNDCSEPVLLLWVCNVLMCQVESKKRHKYLVFERTWSLI